MNDLCRCGNLIFTRNESYDGFQGVIQRLIDMFQEEWEASKIATVPFRTEYHQCPNMNPVLLNGRCRNIPLVTDKPCWQLQQCPRKLAEVVYSWGGVFLDSQYLGTETGGSSRPSMWWILFPNQKQQTWRTMAHACSLGGWLPRVQGQPGLCDHCWEF